MGKNFPKIKAHLPKKGRFFNVKMGKENNIQTPPDPEEIKRAEEHMEELQQANGHADWRVVVDLR